MDGVEALASSHDVAENDELIAFLDEPASLELELGIGDRMLRVDPKRHLDWMGVPVQGEPADDFR